MPERAVVCAPGVKCPNKSLLHGHCYRMDPGDALSKLLLLLVRVFQPKHNFPKVCSAPFHCQAAVDGSCFPTFRVKRFPAQLNLRGGEL